MTATLADRIAHTIRQDVKSMHAYAIQPSAGMVKLDAMENPFRLPPALQRELGERLGRVAINRYPTQCAADVVAALARFVELPAGCRLMLGNGSDELIDMLSVACDVPGAAVLAPLPGFVMYEMSARLRGLRFVGVPLTAGFELDEAAMLAAIEAERPALTYIAYPNNPTANLFDDAVIDRIVAAVGAQQGLVVFDEAYQPFASRTWLQRMAGPGHEHVLVMRTLSKFGLAGVRLGYLCGHAALIDEVEKVRPPYNVSVLNAEATLFALEHADEYARQAAVLCAERERLQHAARAAGRDAVPQRGQHDPRARARFGTRLRGHEGARRARQAHRRPAPAAGELPAADRRHARGERPDDRRPESEPVMRSADVQRDTQETQIHVRLNLDGSGASKLATGIGFFDHMLDQIARHGLIDLEIEARGDLHIDGHHTVEDVGITLGMAVAQAVGDKRGITRYGHAYVPLDEALSRVVVDFSGRPGLHMDVPFRAGMIGGFDTQLTYEFFQGFANHALVTLHIDNLKGQNAHHQCETVFKAFARALRMALAPDPRAAGTIPSTKGSL
jgi:histidinol-phosphate aminotransferase